MLNEGGCVTKSCHKPWQAISCVLRRHALTFDPGMMCCAGNSMSGADQKANHIDMHAICPACSPPASPQTTTASPASTVPVPAPSGGSNHLAAILGGAIGGGVALLLVGETHTAICLVHRAMLMLPSACSAICFPHGLSRERAAHRARPGAHFITLVPTSSQPVAQQSVRPFWGPLTESV